MRSLWISIALLVTGCKFGAAQQPASDLRMDLGPQGNQSVVDAYNALDTSPCSGASVVVTGFFDFGGNTNITGKALDVLASGATEDSSVPSVRNNVAVNENGVPTGGQTGGPTGASLTDAPASPDAKSLLRLATVAGLPVCLATLPVNPMAPALAHKIVLNTGVLYAYSLGQRSGNGYVESGGYNQTTTDQTYYDGNGATSTLTNTSTLVVESDAPTGAVTFSWSQPNIAAITGINSATAPRTANNYICNATGYVIAAAIGKTITYLPGLQLQALPSGLKQGFLHVDDTQSATKVALDIRKLLVSQIPEADDPEAVATGTGTGN